MKYHGSSFPILFGIYSISSGSQSSFSNLVWAIDATFDATIDAAVPSNYPGTPHTINDDSHFNSASPPSGPLPAGDDLCIEGVTGGIKGSCSVDMSNDNANGMKHEFDTRMIEDDESGLYYCVNDTVANEEYETYNVMTCFHDSFPQSPSDQSAEGEKNGRNMGDFVTPDLKPGEITPILWRRNRDRKKEKESKEDDENGVDDDSDDDSEEDSLDGKIVSENAYLVGIPRTLISSLQNYCDELGITDLMRKFTSTDPIPAEKMEDHNGRFVELNDGNRWYAQRPAKKWRSNMHWVSPADEKTHEEYLKVLAEGDFDMVLKSIGKALQLNSLVAYHLTFIGVSHTERGFVHHDTTETGASVWNVIIPLILEEDENHAHPELILVDDSDTENDDTIAESSSKGGLKYKVGMGAMMGDDVMHGTYECDYRNIDGNGRTGLRLAATVYIADITKNNVDAITEQTLTQIFPLADPIWLSTQRGRHWSKNNETISLRNDVGRKLFIFEDKLADCKDRAERGMCERDPDVMRVECLKSCNIYEENLNIGKELPSEDDGDDDEIIFEMNSEAGSYEEGYYIDRFFNSLPKRGNPCSDWSDECPQLAQEGMCVEDKSYMEEEMGCLKSCLYCLTPDSLELFSTGTKQLLELEDELEYTDDEDDNEEEVYIPTIDEVMGIIETTEEYFAKVVLRKDEYAHVRLACRNYDDKCAIWAAQGHCEKNPDWMGQTCAAACLDCMMADYQFRCPVDYDSNVVGAGGINKIFERLLKEAGQDPTNFANGHIPVGGSHPYGELEVISSPYHNVEEYLSEEEMNSGEEFSPLPWVVAIEGFLSDEECKKLIELGENKGYELSTVYSPASNIDGTANFVESRSRTSTNAWCDSECMEDPIVAQILERMENVTGVSSDNYERLQLVRYEEGQYYQTHHDFTESHEDTMYGPRILTFYLYLNDVEAGGETDFPDLGYKSYPKRGKALLWPSVLDAYPDTKDEWTEHQALPVVAGQKYGANAWVHLRNFRHVPEHCII